MGREFSDLEGLRIAVEMEKRGAELYRHGAKLSTQPEVCVLLKRLEQDELRHQAAFAGHYERLLSQGAKALGDTEEGAYLCAVAADVVFPEGLIGLAQEQAFDSTAGLLRAAIESETDSILFYEERAECAGDLEGHDVFAQIVKEERVHMQELVQMLKTEEEP